MIINIYALFRKDDIFDWYFVTASEDRKKLDLEREYLKKNLPSSKFKIRKIVYDLK